MELQLAHLTKKYGQHTALKDFDLTLTEGIYGFLGPNGAGKSTLMNIITGNLHATSGQVLYNGEDIEKLGAVFRGKLGYMPQQQALYSSFTAVRYLDYVAALRGMTKESARAEIPKVLELIGLSDVARKKVGSFSGGMKQRLLIAQAVLADPEVLILDEPTAGLDPKQRIAIRNMISHLAMHKIVILATHVVSDIEYIAKEIVLMERGEILKACSRSELLSAMEGRVFELRIREEQLSAVSSAYKVSGIASGADGIYVRVLSEEKPADYEGQEVRATLEDVYLWYCED